MCSLKGFLALGCIILSSLSIFELIYSVTFVIKYFEEFTKFNLTITVFLNVAMVFFGALLIIGAIKSSVELLFTCLIYFLMEFGRCLIGSFDICNHNSEMSEKLFVLFDTGMDALSKINFY